MKVSKGVWYHPPQGNGLDFNSLMFPSMGFQVILKNLTDFHKMVKLYGSSGLYVQPPDFKSCAICNAAPSIIQQDACCAFTPAILVWTMMQFSDTSPSHGKARQQRPLGLRHKIVQECRFVSPKKSSSFYNSWPPAGVIM